MMPWWIPAIAAFMHFLSLIWVYLVIKDTKNVVDGQLWVVSDEHESVVNTPGLKWIKRFYVLTMLMWIPISFILIYL